MTEVKKEKKLLEGWKRVKLAEIIEENKKSPFKVEDADNKGGYTFFTSGNNILRHSEFLVEGENLFLSTGGTAYVCYNKGKASYSTDTYSVKSKITARLLYYIISREIEYIAFRFFIGSGLEHLQKTDFKNNFEIVFPKLISEQSKIAEILETIDNAIEKTDQIIEKYKSIKQGLMQDLLTKGIVENGQIRSEETVRFKDSSVNERIPEEWGVVRLGDVVGSIKRGPSLSVSNQEGGVIYLTSDYLDETGKIIWSNLKYLKTSTNIDFCKLDVGDVVINCVNSLDQLGRVALFEGYDYPVIVGFNNLAVSPNKALINPEYLAYALMTKRVQNNLKVISKPAVNQVSYGKRDLSEVKILRCPLPEQRRITSVLSQIDNTIEVNQKYKEKLERIKQGIMQDLLTGKVRVNHLIEKVDNVPQA